MLNCNSSRSCFTVNLPAAARQRWRGNATQRRQIIQTVLPGVRTRTPRYVSSSGTDHCSRYSAHQKHSERMNSYFQHTVGVQTDYRDSETQTDPYSPDYILRPGEAIPEILTLAPVTWGNGLPAGLDVVEMIERIRKKRAWEATLPPLNDPTQVGKRNRMIADMERKEWDFREQEINELQEARLALFVQMLQARVEKKYKVTVQKLYKRFSQLEKEKAQRISQFHKIFSLRKIKSKTTECMFIRQDINNKDSDYSAQEYESLSGHRVFPDQHAGLSNLEPQRKPKRPKESKNLIRHSKHRETGLLMIHEDLEKAKVKEKKPLRFLYRVVKPVPRPATPVVDMPPEGHEEKELAVIFLQKLLRGRSIQNQMLEGLEEQRELIQELRSTHILHQEDQDLLSADKKVTMDLHIQKEICENRNSKMHSYIDGVSGKVIGDMLDFLAKEQVRLQEERKIHAFMLLAERERRLREAEESGRRQMEERRRREEDEIFRQAMNVHKSTVDQFLEDVVLDSIDQTAEDQAREEIHNMAEEFNEIAYAMENVRNIVQSQEIVSQLVYGFLIPDIHRETVCDRVRQKQRRHLTAAHSVIHGTDSSTTIPRSSSPPTRASTSLLSQIIEQVNDA